MAHRIVNRIVIEGEQVFIMDAGSNERPLRFLRREEPVYTETFQREGLRGLMGRVAREMHRGEIRLRAGSMITRALRRGLHAIGLERFQKMESGRAAEHLAAMAAHIMEDWDCPLQEELDALEAELSREEPESGGGETVRVRLLGELEIENSFGRVTENRGRQSLPFLLLKYLLVNEGREVSLGEVTERVWTGEENSPGAARVRLRRLREALEPVGLDGLDGLVLYKAEKYSLNRRFRLETDTELLEDILGMLRDAPGEEGIELVGRGLELFRGEFLEGTEAAWLKDRREHYREAFYALAREGLERMKDREDDRYLPLLCRRCAELAAGEEALQRELIRCLMERGRDVELTRHITRLSRSGKAHWLTEDL